jgi:methionyl-tRNA formyltransferase
MQLQANAIKRWAIARGIDVQQPRRCGQAETALLRERGIDLVLVMAYGQILKPDLLAAPPLGVVNFHASLLPRLRGASPIHTAIALGLAQTGVSLMRIIPQLDAGPVADTEAVPILPTDHPRDLHQRLADACVPLLQRNLGQLLNGSLAFHEQDPARVTYCRIIDKDDAALDFNQPATALANRIRAFQPWPGATFDHNGCTIKILAAQARTRSSNAQPGTLLIEQSTCAIACADGLLELTTLQRPGGRPLPADAFLRGYPLNNGEHIPSHSMRPLEAPTPFPYRKRHKASE